MKPHALGLVFLVSMSGCAMHDGLPGGGGDGPTGTDGGSGFDAARGPDAGSCDGLDRLACEAAAQTLGCVLDTCCGKLIKCRLPSEPPMFCAADCVNSCIIREEGECTAQVGCHPVYLPFNGCGCAPAGCCTLFDHCADGATATCYHVMPTCKKLPPDCQGDYVVSYDANLCYDGCVHQNECALTP
jgi:hypothetical protein